MSSLCATKCSEYIYIYKSKSTVVFGKSLLFQIFESKISKSNEKYVSI